MSELIELLTREGAVSIDDNALRGGVEADAGGTEVREMTRLVYVLWQRWVRQGAAINHEALEILVRSSQSLPEEAEHLRSALDYLFLWAEAIRYSKAADLAGPYHEVFTNGDHVAAIGRRVDAMGDELSTEYGALMFRALLASTSDRDTAAGLFHAANAANPEFAKATLLDQFASTYFSTTELSARADEVDERRRALLSEFRLLSEPKQGDDGSTLLLFSCDPVYFAIYLPYWISLCQYMLDLDINLHFVLVCEQQEASEILDRGEQVIESTAHLRGGDLGLLSKHLSFSHVETPGYVKDRTTFYACARYLVAMNLDRRFKGRVVILDIDMTVRSDPAMFLQRLREVSDLRLPMTIASGLQSLIPARRYMAGTFPVPKGELGERVMSSLESYIYAGLSSEVSGTLDQNALAYVAEGMIGEYGHDALIAVGRLGQPFTQLAPVKQMQEAGQRKLEARS